jgi:NAD(P)-dependent dehydrogenase (short-subunit alcohol dehydrogenase family)
MVRSPLLRAEIAGSAWPPPSASSLTGRRQTELDGAVKSIGENVTGIQGDVAKLADLDRIYSTVRKQKGRLDVLFANAGGGSLVPLDRSPKNTLIRSLTPTYAVCFSPCVYLERQRQPSL